MITILGTLCFTFNQLNSIHQAAESLEAITNPPFECTI